MTIRFCLLFALFMTLSTLLFGADQANQTQQTQTQTQTVPLQTFLSADESQLQSMIQNLLNTSKTAKEAEMIELDKKLILPNYEIWFKQVFGDAAGVKLAEEYKELDKHLRSDHSVKELKIVLDSGRSEIVVTRLAETSDPKHYYNQILSKMETKPEIYEVRLDKPGKAGEFFEMGFFSYVDGAFRLLGDFRAIR